MLEQSIRRILMDVRDQAASEGIVATLTLHHEKSHLMRIGNNSVSLNTTENLMRLDVEVTNGRSQGSQTYLGAIDSAETVRSILNKAVETARLAAPKTYDPILDEVEESIMEEDQYDQALADLDPGEKAQAYDAIFKSLGEEYNFSGAWSSGSMEIYILTTANRNEAHHRGTDQLFTVVLKHPDKKWELVHNQTGWKAEDFKVGKTTEALGRLLPVYEEKSGFKVEPGDYTVIFGSEAVSEITNMALYTGFSGRGWEEKQSWTSKSNPGDKILGENISLIDDPSHPGTFMFGFDMAGKRRNPFPFVENGILKNLMYDSSTAARYGKKPTGHNIRSIGAVLSTGSGPRDALQAVKDLGRVLYIPALHYMNIPSLSKGIFTGSSRFNALLVENGEVVSPIFSTRVTDTFQNVLGNVKVISEVSESVNGSNTYGRRNPVATSVPSYIVAQGVKITDSADSF